MDNPDPKELKRLQCAFTHAIAGCMKELPYSQAMAMRAGELANSDEFLKLLYTDLRAMNLLAVLSPETEPTPVATAEKLQAFTFQAGNSSPGPVGYSAKVIAYNEAAAVELLRSLVEEKDGTYDLVSNREEGTERVDYLTVYINQQAIHAGLVDETEDANEEEVDEDELNDGLDDDGDDGYRDRDNPDAETRIANLANAKAQN